MIEPASPFYSDIGRSLHTISPAENAVDQSQPFTPPGLTVVFRIPSGARTALGSVLEIIEKSRNTFRRSVWPHVTIQAVLGRNEIPLSPSDHEVVLRSSDRILRELAPRLEPVPVSFGTIRPGIDPRDPSTGNGTMIWLAEGEGSDRLQSFGNSLRERLQEVLPVGLRGLSLQKVKPVWITLGYFDETGQFDIDERLQTALHRLHHTSLAVEVDRLELSEFTFKLLAEGRALSVVPLG